MYGVVHSSALALCTPRSCGDVLGHLLIEHGQEVMGKIKNCELEFVDVFWNLYNS